jgi:hypothetical protein
MRPHAAVIAALLLAGCQGASSSLGLDAILRVQGAQAVSGSITEYPGSPLEATVRAPNGLTSIYPGLEGREINGKVGPGASGVAIGLAGDRVFWALPAGAHDTQDPELLLFTAQLAFSPELDESGLVQVDETGRPVLPLIFRPLTPLGQVGEALALDLRPQQPESLGSLVVTLEWTGASDLDLRVVAPAPDGSGSVEIWSKHPSNKSADGEGGSANASERVGVLDMDSNAACDIDHRKQENVIWQGAPPAGNYQVRVDAFSLCAERTAEWMVRATYDGQLLVRSDGQPAQVFGLFTEAATRGDHGAGAGQTAFDFNIELRTP